MNKKYNNKDLLEASGHDWKTNKIWKLSQEDDTAGVRIHLIHIS